MVDDPEVRNREVLGARERLSFLGEEHLDDRHRTALEELRLLYGYPEGTPLAPFYANLAHSPDFFADYMALGCTASLRSALPARARELAVLRTAWLCGAPYAWGEHVHSTRGVLFAPEEIEAITVGSEAGGWGDLDRAVLRAAEELHARAMIGDETWALLAAHFDERQLLELPMVVGHYAMTAYVQNSLRSRLNAHNPGLTAR